MGVVEAIVAAVLEVVAVVVEVFELIRNAVSRMPDNGFTARRED